MTKPRVWILYEDARGPQKNFAPHELLLACVGDLLQQDYHSFKTLVEANPRKGVGELLKSCRNDVERLCAMSAGVIAVFDNDQVRKHFQPPLPKTATDDEVVKAIADLAKGRPNFFPVLLDRNLETLIDAIASCERSVGGTVASGEAVKKDHRLRDRFCMRAARSDAELIRTCVGQKMPSFASLIERARTLVAPQLAALALEGEGAD